MTEPSPGTVDAWIALMAASRTLLRRIEAALKAASFPPLSWYDALLEIERAGGDGVRPFELRARLLLPQYGTSRMLDRLEADGLVARDACAQDGRGQVVRITEAGLRMRRRMWPVYAGRLEALIGDRLGVDERARLVGLLAKLGEA